MLEMFSCEYFVLCLITKLAGFGKIFVPVQYIIQYVATL